MGFWQYHNVTNDNSHQIQHKKSILGEKKWHTFVFLTPGSSVWATQFSGKKQRNRLTSVMKHTGHIVWFKQSHLMWSSNLVARECTLLKSVVFSGSSGCRSLAAQVSCRRILDRGETHAQTPISHLCHAYSTNLFAWRIPYKLYLSTVSPLGKWKRQKQRPSLCWLSPHEDLIKELENY